MGSARCSSSAATACCSTSSTCSEWADARLRRSARAAGARARPRTQPHARATLDGGHVCAGAQPVARDQGVRGRRAGAGVPARALDAARPAAQVRALGRGRRQRAAGAAPVPVGARSRRCAARARSSSCCAMPPTSVDARSSACRDRLDIGLTEPATCDGAADTPRPALPADGPHRHRARADGPRRARVARRRDRHRSRSGNLIAVGAILRHPYTSRSRRCHHRRRAHDRRDDGQPLRSGAQGQRGRRHHASSTSRRSGIFDGRGRLRIKPG